MTVNKLRETKYGMMNEFGRIVIRKIHNDKFDYDKEFLDDRGSSKMNELFLCPKCYDAFKPNIPSGVKIHQYRENWENLEKAAYRIEGKTVISYYRCDKCGYEEEHRDTFKQSIKRRPIKKVRGMIISYIRSSMKSMQKARWNRKYYPEGLHRHVGAVKAYMNSLELLGGYNKKEDDFFND